MLQVEKAITNRGNFLKSYKDRAKEEQNNQASIRATEREKERAIECVLECQKFHQTTVFLLFINTQHDFTTFVF